MCKLDELQKLCDKTTPGPWEFHHYGEPAFNDSDETGFSWWVQSSDKQQIRICDHENTNHMNGKFIAASRTYMPLLIEVVKTLKSIQLCADTYQDHEGELEKALEKLERG